jgi:hypothetical protein
MREHQIVITLKPDQFLEVQRLARAANAKSMGVFVRQQLLAALGIEGALQTDAAASSNIDVEAILADLKRVHGDLKGFVAESLSPYSPEAFGQTEPLAEIVSATIAEVEDTDSSELVLQTVSMLHAEEAEPMPDELERIADKTFAISPRLGSVGEVEQAAEAASSAAPSSVSANATATTSRTEVQPQAQATGTENNGNGNGNGKPHDLLSRHELHYRRDMHRYNHPHAASEFMDVPFNESAPQALPFAAQSETPSRSPGLSSEDPLSKLLSGDELTSRPVKPRLELEEADDDPFDVPLSIAERTRMLSEDAPTAPIPMVAPIHPALQPTSPADLQHNMDMAAAEPASYDAPQLDHEPELATDPVEEVLAPVSAEQAAETSTNTASAAAGNDPNPLTRPLGYPPLSGSPPPKRRQL